MKIDPLLPDQSRGERYLRQLFNRPWLVALVVGSAIHGLITLDLWWFGSAEYLPIHWQLLIDNPVCAVIQLLIPYFVPWVITSMANRLNCKSRDCLMAAFPEANPDLVIKLDSHGTPRYINRAVIQRLYEAGLSLEHPEEILPHDYRQRLFGNAETTLRLWHEVQGQHIEYLARREPGSGGVFISGRIQTV
jgi:hypothetical protein